MQIVKALAIILEPFTPLTAEKLWGLLNLPDNVHKQTWSEATTPIQSGHKINKAEPLFHKILANEKELQTLLEEGKSKAG